MNVTCISLANRIRFAYSDVTIFSNIAHNDTLWDVGKLQLRSPVTSRLRNAVQCELIASIQAAVCWDAMLCNLRLRVHMWLAFSEIGACVFPSGQKENAVSVSHSEPPHLKFRSWIQRVLTFLLE